MAVSIIIPCLNAPGLAHTLASLRQQTQAASIDEIIIVGLVEPGAIEGDSKVRYISTGSPVGPATARNIGVQHAVGDLLCFIDADCVASKGWLAALLKRNAAGEKIIGGSVGFDKENYWTLADNLSMFHEYLDTSPRGRRPYLPTLNLLVERDVFLKVGNLDEALPRGEDIDWTIRARHAGFDLYFEPEASILHRPTRGGPRTVWKHWWDSGFYMGRVRWQYRDEFETPGIIRSAPFLWIFAPIIGLWSTARLFSENRHNLRLLHTAPAVWLTKIAWCLGAARRAQVGYE